MEFTFDVVKSVPHKGKMLIRYEPNISQSLLMDTNKGLNEQKIYILDLASSSSVTIRVPWNRQRGYCDVGNNSIYNNVVGNPVPVTFGNNFCNGYLIVEVFNELVSRDSVGVDVLVFAKASEDMEFQYFTSENIPDEMDIPAQGLFTSYDENVCEIIPKLDRDIYSSICFGEVIMSLRSLVNRRVSERVYTAAGENADDVQYRLTSLMYPEQYPLVGTSSNPNLPTLIGYLRNAYLGIKGSVVRSCYYTMTGGDASQDGSVIRASNDTLKNLNPSRGVTDSSSGQSLLRWEGSATYNNVNRYVNATIPYQANNFFLYSPSVDLTGGLADPQMDTTFLRSYLVDILVRGNSTAGTLVEDVEAGDDFTLCGFIAPPPFTE